VLGKLLPKPPEEAPNAAGGAGLDEEPIPKMFPAAGGAADVVVANIPPAAVPALVSVPGKPPKALPPVLPPKFPKPVDVLDCKVGAGRVLDWPNAKEAAAGGPVDDAMDPNGLVVVDVPNPLAVDCATPPNGPVVADAPPKPLVPKPIPGVVDSAGFAPPKPPKKTPVLLDVAANGGIEAALVASVEEEAAVGPAFPVTSGEAIFDPVSIPSPEEVVKVGVDVVPGRLPNTLPGLKAGVAGASSVFFGAVSPAENGAPPKAVVDGVDPNVNAGAGAPPLVELPNTGCGKAAEVLPVEAVEVNAGKLGAGTKADVVAAGVASVVAGFNVPKVNGADGNDKALVDAVGAA